MDSWVMKCGCGHFNIPSTDATNVEGILNMVQEDGPSCAKCGRLINVHEGEWVPAVPGMRAIGQHGVHIPQFIVPAVVYNPMRWAKLYELKLTGNTVKFLQEILGIATEEGARELSQKQLQAICTLGRDVRALQQKAISRKYQFVVSGCDWGGSDYVPAKHMKVSTTVHAMAGVTPKGEVEIIHFRRYSGMNYDSIADDIVANHLKFGGTAIATDFGVGAVYNSKIREKIPMDRPVTHVTPSHFSTGVYTSSGFTPSTSVGIPLGR